MITGSAAIRSNGRTRVRCRRLRLKRICSWIVSAGHVLLSSPVNSFRPCKCRRPGAIKKVKG